MNELYNEIEALKVLNHPNIVHVHEVIAKKTRIHIILDLLHGPALNSSEIQPTIREMWEYSR